MNGNHTDDLDRALQIVTIFQIWEHAVRDGAIATLDVAPQRDGLVKSPFRDDGRSGSFSICHGGRGFKDFGGDGQTGNAWKFAKLCWPSLEKKEIAQKLIEISGITPTPKPGVRPPVSLEQGGVAPVDPRLLRAAKALERRDRVRQAEEAVYENLERQLKSKIEFKPLASWPNFVRERYLDGWRVLRSATAKMSQLAKDRGWPATWVCELVGMGLLSYPLERWTDSDSPRARRQKAFRVDVPDISVVADDKGGAKALAVLRPVGYHQRWFALGQEGENPSKGWLYIPSVPKKDPLSHFEKDLLTHAATQGVTPDNVHSLVPALPFVLGDLDGARVIVILEGQWDAITFFGACGWFEDCNPPVGVAVFGIRGAQGVDVFLTYWARWLLHNRPLALVIADNDNAGRTWREPPPAQEGMPRPPSFAERLQHAGCRNVLTSWLKPADWGKDFNDYYRHAKPGPAAMAAWLTKMGVMGANGKWA